MPKMRLLNYLLKTEFGTDVFVDATEPFILVLNGQDLKAGKQLDVLKCPYKNCAMRTQKVAKSLVTEYFSYIQFKRNGPVFRYQNSGEVVANIRLIDQDRADEVETGEYILEPPKGARSLAYSRKRRSKIKDGDHTPKPRGPNKNPRKQIVHLRPY